MKEKLKRILMIMFCLPIMPIIGVPGTGGGSTDSDSNDEDDHEGNDVDDSDDSDENDDDEPKSYSKEELDKLLKQERSKAVRDYKKSKFSGKKPSPKEKSDDEETDEKMQKLQLREQKAKERELSGVIKSSAYELNLTPRGTNAALKIADFSECYDDDGNLDEDLVNSVLEDFVKEYPEFLAKSSNDDNDDDKPKFSSKTKKIPLGDKKNQQAYLDNKYSKNPFYKK